MISRLDHKVPGGKLLRVEVEYEGGTVIRARIAGDFFAHPETLFEEAEAALAGTPIDRIGPTAIGLFSSRGLVLFGAGPEDIAEALREAIRGNPAP